MPSFLDRLFRRRSKPAKVSLPYSRSPIAFTAAIMRRASSA